LNASFIALRQPSKVISWDTLYLVFKDRFHFNFPNPDLDAPDSFRLPLADELSSQGNGDF